MASRAPVGVGQVYVWPGGSLWIGRATGATDLHAHHAVQVSFGESGDLKFRSRSDGWSSYRACLVPSNVPHAFLGADILAAHIFVEPESLVGRRLLEKFSPRTVQAIPGEVANPAARVLFTAWADSRQPARLVPAAHAALGQLTGGEAPRESTDPRVLGAIEIVQARLDGRLTLTDVAREVCMSPSRLRHLFVEETGLPFRRYVLWQRLQRVFAMLPSETMTDAAHAAGFADAAHMTRTFRRMLGVAPTSLKRE